MQQIWPWWPLLPLYPYGRRRTFIQEITPNQIWSFEQLHGVWYVAVPIRMTVVKVGDGLMLYSPIPPTGEVVAALRVLEEQHGPIRTIVLASTSGLEHKIPLPAMARAFPDAVIWISDKQWSFPIQLPSRWLGFPAKRTKILFRDGVPHPEQLSWIPLGPLDLGLGSFLEVACLDHASGSLLVTDALVAIRGTPPELFNTDPTPLLFHARERGSEALRDTPENRVKGWKRIILFANYFRPGCISVPGLKTIVAELFHRDCRNAKSHFGFYPFQWSKDWEEEADRFLGEAKGSGVRIAPVLERLVFPRAKTEYVNWLKAMAKNKNISQLIGCHYHAPEPMRSDDLIDYSELIQKREWAPSHNSWATLASIDQTLIRLGIVHPST